MVETEERPTVVLAGATGFVGYSLRQALAGRYRLIGLTRSSARDRIVRADEPIEWRSCDLFSLLEVEAALAGADYAIYLVHSMLPSARLLQGSFSDLDLILADNFARAAQHCGLRQIVYLGGLIPPGATLSPHLASRLEVERALRSGRTPVTALRAGLVVGPGGSSLRIVVNLVRRLPVMILPEWTDTPTQPIAIEDVRRAVTHCLGNPETFGRHYDIGGPEVMTYRAMLATTAAVLGRKRWFLNVPFVSPHLSKLWVALLGGASRYLVSPLVDSLRHPMIVADNPVQAHLAPTATPFAAALRASLTDDGALRSNPREVFRKDDARTIRAARRVRSVQRLPLPEGFTAEDVAREFHRFLPRLVRPFLRGHETPDRRLRVSFLLRRWPLIEFSYAAHRSSPERQLFYLTGGVLVHPAGHGKGRIEFREMLDRHCLIAAIHDYRPRLPWFIYRHTQAVFHLRVMRRFARHLSRLAPP
jgi:uncharacterized protein YbjT (DUF2867 family)